MNEFLDLALRATLLLAVAFVGWLILSSQSAQARSAWLRAAILGLVALPAWIVAGPQFHFEVPWVEKPSPTLVSSWEATPVVVVNDPFNWSWLWAVVAGLLAVRMTLGGLALARMWSHARAADDDLTDELYQALARLDVSRPVDFRVAQVGSPMTFGVRRACVVVPEDFARWPEAHREAALMHEAAHIRRFDCGWQWLATSLRALLWCHPLVWWLAHALRDEAELAADERVVAAGIEATDYATALVEIARTKSQGNVPVAGTAFMREGQLTRRVTSVLQSRRGGFSAAGSLGLMAAAMGVVVAVAGLRPQLPKADVLIVRGKPTQIALNDAPSGDLLPADVDDLVVTTDAGLDPLPNMSQRRASAPKIVVRQTRPATTVAPDAPSSQSKTRIEATIVDTDPQIRASTTEVSIVLTDPVAVAPKSGDTRRVVVLTTAEAPSMMAERGTRTSHEVYAFQPAEGKDLRVQVGPRTPMPPIPDNILGWTAADREEIRRSMETLERDLMFFYVDERVSEKARKSMEEALRLAELAQLAELAARNRSLAPPPPASTPGN